MVEFFTRTDLNIIGQDKQWNKCALYIAMLQKTTVRLKKATQNTVIFWAMLPLVVCKTLGGPPVLAYTR